MYRDEVTPLKDKIIILVLLILIVGWIVLSILFENRYHASFAKTFYYTFSIKNIDSKYCSDLKLQIMQDKYSERTMEIIKDPWIALKSDEDMSYIINRWYGKTAWRCINDIIENIDSMPIDNFDLIWFDENKNKDNKSKIDTIWEWEYLNKRWAISGTFFAIQEMSWNDELKKWMKNDYLTFSEIKNAGILWSKSDYTSYNSCKTITDKKLFSPKDTSEDTIISDCVNKIHKYLITSSTAFSKTF